MNKVQTVMINGNKILIVFVNPPNPIHKSHYQAYTYGNEEKKTIMGTAQLH